MIMKNSILFTCIIIFLINFSFSQGLIIDSEEEWNKIPKIESDFGFASTIPSKFSLEEYVPVVQYQQGGTCTGFAVNYYALSTMYNISFGVKDEIEKFMFAFDPYFSYSIIKEKNLDPDDNECSRGLKFTQVIAELQDSGAKKLWMKPFDNSCNETWTKERLDSIKSYTRPYSLDFPGVAAFDTENLNLEKLKNTIFQNNPIVIGVLVTKSLERYSLGDENRPDNIIGVKDDGLWSPRDNEKIIAKHAMCIVGYDDEKFGGSFQVVNSWGRKYGDKGYVWIKYNDLKKYVTRAFILKINKNVKSDPVNKEGIKFGNYVRYSYESGNTNKLNIYEGQLIDGKITGHAIFYHKPSETIFAGEYLDGKRNGEFFVYQDNKFKKAYYENSILVNPDELGFSKDNLNIQIGRNNDIESKLAKLGLPYDGIRKASSTSNNVIPPDEK